MRNITDHQKGQIAVINQIEEATKNQKVSVVSPVADFEADKRICLTTVHFPNQALIGQIYNQITELLKAKHPGIYFYKPTSLHTTIKNVRVIQEPPSFSEDDVRKVETEFSKVLSKHKKYRTYFYRLLLLQNSLSLMGTTDPELDSINFDLDNALNRIGIPDDKKYINKKYFLSNVTLARFGSAPEGFKKEVERISKTLLFEPYTIDSVTLIVANATTTVCRKIHTWQLKD